MSEETRDFQIGDRVRVVLSAEVIGLSTDKEWLLLSPGRIWVPIDEFVERIVPEPESDEHIPIREGDTVRVLTPGKFQGQEVLVLQAKERRPYRRRRGSIDYQLDTKLDDKPYPAWFGHTEIEKVAEKGQS